MDYDVAFGVNEATFNGISTAYYGKNPAFLRV